MSIYEVLSYKIPIIGYSVFHQPKKSASEKDYAELLISLRQALNGESDNVKSIWENYLGEVTEKSVQSTRGNLSQYLTTPLKSDLADIHKIIGDQIHHLSEQFLPKIRYGLSGGRDAKVLFGTQYTELPRTQAAAAKSYLKTMGYKVGVNDSSIYESFYIVEGGSNLDLLEYLVKCRIGVHESVHGKKAQGSDHMTCSVSNLIASSGEDAGHNDRYEFQAALSRGDIAEEHFTRGMEEVLAAIDGELGGIRGSLWQRKLGLGMGNEFTLRIQLRDRAMLHHAIALIQRISAGDKAVRKQVNTGIWTVQELIDSEN